MIWDFLARRFHGNVFILTKVDAGVCCSEEFKLNTFVTGQWQCVVDVTTSCSIPFSTISSIIVAIVSWLSRFLPTIVDWCDVVAFLLGRWSLRSDFRKVLMSCEVVACCWWTEVITIIRSCKCTRSTTTTTIVITFRITVLIATTTIIVVIVIIAIVLIFTRIVVVTITTTIIIESTVIIPLNRKTQLFAKTLNKMMKMMTT